MQELGFIVLDDHMLNQVTDILHNYKNIVYKVGLVTRAEQMAEEFLARGIDIVIARGATANTIARRYPALAVVEIPVTGFDWIRAIEAAKRHGPKIAVITLTTIERDIRWLNPVLGVCLENFPVKNYSEVERAILTASSQKFDCILCGGLSAKLAQQYGIPCELLTMNTEGVLQAVQQANQISKALEYTQKKHVIMTTVFDTIDEGIVTIDENCFVTSFNNTAAKLTKFKKDDVLGADIQTFWPDLELGSTVSTRKTKTGQMLSVSGNSIICDKSPIIMNGAVVGGAATFNEVSRIEQMGATIRRNTYAHGHAATYTFADICGDSPEIRQAVVQAKSFAGLDAGILLLGETGTGKELFAQSIHNAAARASEPFVAVNCASLPGHILESELFGYVGGAFTGANQGGKIGLFETAHKGTLFLDEIGDMDHNAQGILLRFLQDKTIRRLGSDKNVNIDVRVIAATNKDLDKLVAERIFRSDLYYRLNVFSLTLPPLRDRKCDIPILIDNFIKFISNKKPSQTGFHASAMEAIRRHDWPGNIRELENFVRRCLVAVNKKNITAKDIKGLFSKQPPENIKLRIEQQALLEALTTANGKLGEAARSLGVTRTTLWRRLKRHNLR